jgi:hypothetical protein
MEVTTSTHRARAGGADAILLTPAAGHVLTTLVRQTHWTDTSQEAMRVPRFAKTVRAHRWTRCCVISSATRTTFLRQ